MAERNFEMNFEIDMAKVYAKLHLAGQSQVGAPLFVINTGIVNPQDKGDPTKVDKTTFDFKNETYEVGVCNPTFEYSLPLDPKQIDKIVKLEEQIEKEDPKSQEEKDKETSLTDNKKVEQNDNENKKINKLYTNLVKAYKDAFDKSFSSENKPKEEKDNDKQTLKNYKESILKENESRKNKKTENLDAVVKTIVDGINNYMEQFAGKQDFKKINESQVNIIQLDLDGKINKPTKFKSIENFQIIGLSEDEINKKSVELQKKGSANIITSTVCGKIQYTLDSKEG